MKASHIKTVPTKSRIRNLQVGNVIILQGEKVTVKDLKRGSDWRHAGGPFSGTGSLWTLTDQDDNKHVVLGSIEVEVVS